MKLIAIIFSILLASTCFMSSTEAHHRRLLKKLAKGALLAKLLKPKLNFLPLPLPIPIPLPINIQTKHEPVYVAKHEPIVYAEPLPYAEPYGLPYGGY